MRIGFDGKIIDITKHEWIFGLEQPKHNGIETIPASRIKFSPNGYEFLEDEKVIVFRFNSQNGRIIGVKDALTNVFYIIGLDLGFNAYKH